MIITGAWAPDKTHLMKIGQTLLMGLNFAVCGSIAYNKFRIAGVAIFFGIALIPLFALTYQWLIYPYWFISAVLLAFLLIRHKFPVSWGSWLILFVTAIALVLTVLPYFTLGYSQPFNEAVLAASNAHMDTLYHAAIAAMIKTYGVISHGLHGTGPLEYHFGSHMLMAGASNLSGITIWESYSYFFPFFCVPLLCIAVIAVAEELSPSHRISEFLVKILIFSFFTIGSGVLVSESFIARFALGPSFFESESYTVSLILLVALISVLSKSDKVQPAIFQLAIITAIFSYLTLAKISSAFSGLILIGFWALLHRKPWFKIRWSMRWFTLACAGIIFLVLFKLVNPSMSDAHFQPWQFITAYVRLESPFWLKVTLFLLVHFIFPIGTLMLVWIRFGRSEARNSTPNWLIFAMVTSMAVGMGVVLLLYVQGGSGYYFSNVSMFIALPALIPLMQKRLWENRFTGALLLVIILSGFIAYARPAISRGITAFASGMTEAARKSDLSGYIEKFRQIRDDPTSKATLVFIPRSERKYWESMFCRSTGYFISAISERASLFAWPSAQCYEFLCGPRFHGGDLCEKSQLQYSDQQLLTEAKRLGFKRVDIVTVSGIRHLQ